MDYQNGVKSSSLLLDPFFEKRLKAFDKNLRLVFDQNRKRWTILERFLDGSGWNILLRCQDEFGNPKQIGDWVFDELRKMRRNWEIAIDNPTRYLDRMVSQANEQRQKQIEAVSIIHKEKLLDDIVTWRKAARELQNLPTSDITAGYRKVR